MQLSPHAFNQLFNTLHLNTDRTSLLLSMLNPAELAAGDRLITHHQFSDTLYLVWSGRLTVTVTSGELRLTLGEVGPGRWIGDFGFIDPGKAAADVTATEATTVLALTQDGLKRLYENSPDTASALLQALSLELARRLRVTSRACLEKSSETEYALREIQADRREGLFNRLRKLMGLGGDEQ